QRARAGVVREEQRRLSRDPARDRLDRGVRARSRQGHGARRRRLSGQALRAGGAARHRTPAPGRRRVGTHAVAKKGGMRGGNKAYREFVSEAEEILETMRERLADLSDRLGAGAEADPEIVN